MEMEEINAAAYSSMQLPPEDRETFIKESYQTANIVEIELIKRLANEYKERGLHRDLYK